MVKNANVNTQPMERDENDEGKEAMIAENMALFGHMLEESRKEREGLNELLNQMRAQIAGFCENSEMIMRVEKRVETLQFISEATEKKISEILQFREQIDDVNRKLNSQQSSMKRINAARSPAFFQQPCPYF